jgi:hypothetical protein
MSADEILLSNALLIVLSPFITTTAFLLRKLGKRLSWTTSCFVDAQRSQYRDLEFREHTLCITV